MNSLKILIPLGAFGKSGGYRVLSNLANVWKKNGHEVTFVSYFESESPYFPTDADIIWIDDKGHEVSQESNKCWKTKKNSFIKRITGLYKFLKSKSDMFDIVLANQNFTVWPVALGSKALNFHYIQAYEPDFYDKNGMKNFLQKIVSHIAYYMPLIKVVNSDLYLNYKNIRSKHIIPPGLDLDIYYPKRVDTIVHSPLRVGCIGRKEEWKGIGDVVKAIELLHDLNIEIDFKVAFNRVDYDKYDFVVPNGDSELADFYRSVDVIVAPGWYQLGAIHYPVIEAMACGTAVITTGYYPANTDNAYIVPVKSPEDISRCLIDIMNNPNLVKEKIKQALKDVNQFEWTNLGNNFEDIFLKYLKTK